MTILHCAPMPCIDACMGTIKLISNKIRRTKITLKYIQLKSICNILIVLISIFTHKKLFMNIVFTVYI